VAHTQSQSSPPTRAHKHPHPAFLAEMTDSRTHARTHAGASRPPAHARMTRKDEEEEEESCECANAQMRLHFSSLSLIPGEALEDASKRDATPPDEHCAVITSVSFSFEGVVVGIHHGEVMHVLLSTAGLSEEAFVKASREKKKILSSPSQCWLSSPTSHARTIERVEWRRRARRRKPTKALGGIKASGRGRSMGESPSTSFTRVLKRSSRTIFIKERRLRWKINRKKVSPPPPPPTPPPPPRAGWPASRCSLRPPKL